ncbi:MAG: hypothetical protein IT322_18080 [Anaerolineae bacterium]|nr:hypothetical protein [Anaerolineae bacterium]CAG0978406.1 hypothetical protein ANRL4_01716 [Anaerolineae bacterium]
MSSPQHKKMSDDDLLRLAEDIEALDSVVDKGVDNAAEMVAEAEELTEKFEESEQLQRDRETLNREAQARSDRLREQVTPKPAPKVRPAAPNSPQKSIKRAASSERFEWKLPETQHEWTDFGIKFAICAIGAWLISTAIPVLVSLAAIIILVALVWDNYRKTTNR